MLDIKCKLIRNGVLYRRHRENKIRRGNKKEEKVEGGRIGRLYKNYRPNFCLWYRIDCKRGIEIEAGTEEETYREERMLNTFTCRD